MRAALPIIMFLAILVAAGVMLIVIPILKQNLNRIRSDRSRARAQARAEQFGRWQKSRPTDQDRADVEHQVGQAFARGQITREELDHRLELIQQARTNGALYLIVDDLEVVPRPE